MKTALTALALLVGLAACEPRGERGEATGGIDETNRAEDTIVTTQTEVDTAMVQRDTQISVDTVDAGEGEVRDTINR